MKNLKAIRKNTEVLFYFLLGLLLVTMLYMSFDVGISADESRHYQQAEKVYNYFASKGKDKSAIENTGRDPMQFNGQSFDNLMFVIEKVFKVEKVMEMRHFFNALIGWLIILITGLIAKRFWGVKGAIIAVLLLFISPRFLGHALNNNKDIPFALGFIISFYGIIRFLDELPKPKFKTIIILILGIAIAISIRMAGIVSIAFLGLFSGIYYLVKKPILAPFSSEKIKILTKLLIYIPIIALVGLGLGILFWPFMLEDPITNFKVVLDAMSTHPIALNQLFNGTTYLSNNLPKTYTFIYILYTYPLAVLLGIFSSIVLSFIYIKKANGFIIFTLVFSFVFVILWMSLQNSNIYGGIRHLLFIYPIGILLAVYSIIKFSNISKRFKNKLINYSPIIIIVLLSIKPAIHIVKNYPYSYVYFNELTGGVKNAFGNYETDYFQHSLKHATEWLIENKLKTIPPEDSTSIKIIANDGFNVNYYLKPLGNKIEFSYSRYYEKYSNDWDYAIFYCGYISPHQLKNNRWPPKGTIHTENVDGIPIAAVVKRISYEDYEGFKALKSKKLPEAKQHFEEYLKIFPENEEVLNSMSRLFLMQRNYEKAIIYADSSLMYYPEYMAGLFSKTIALNALKKFDKALVTCNKIIDTQESMPEAHFQKGLALKGLNKPNEALKEFQIATLQKKEYYEAFIQIGEILINYKQYQNAIDRVYQPVLQFRKNDLFTTARVALCYHLLKENDKAKLLLNEIAKINRLYFESIKVRCRIKIEENKLNEAQRDLQMMRNIHNNSELFVIRALFALKTNNNDLAKSNLKKAIEIDANNFEAKTLLKPLTETPNKIVQPVKKPQQSVLFQKEKEKPKNILNP